MAELALNNNHSFTPILWNMQKWLKCMLYVFNNLSLKLKEMQCSASRLTTTNARQMTVKESFNHVL